jgi:hypothetical protein
MALTSWTASFAPPLETSSKVQHRVVVPPPALDDHPGFSQRVEDFSIEQFIAKLTSVTPIDRIASATDWPCPLNTSTCRSFATISSALCLFLGIHQSSIRP